jgi:hypothetical protein
MAASDSLITRAIFVEMKPRSGGVSDFHQTGSDQHISLILKYLLLFKAQIGRLNRLFGYKNYEFKKAHRRPMTLEAIFSARITLLRLHRMMPEGYFLIITTSCAGPTPTLSENTVWATNGDF